MQKSKPSCPICALPIINPFSFCRVHWFELPIPLRSHVTAALQTKDIQAKALAIKDALDWFHMKRSQEPVSNTASKPTPEDRRRGAKILHQGGYHLDKRLNAEYCPDCKSEIEQSKMGKL